MCKITVGVLTISDRCSRKIAIDKSGPHLMSLIEKGVVKNCEIVKTGLVPDCLESIESTLLSWSEDCVNLILTTGGTGISNTDVTPEAMAKVLEKTIPGISYLIFKKCSEVTPLASLSRCIAGVRKKSLIISLPGSPKASEECLLGIAGVIPHAIDLITGSQKNVEHVHASLATKKSSAVICSPADRTRISTYPCITVSEAQNIVMEKICLLRRWVVLGLEEALGHVLAKEVSSLCDQPSFDASLKDGYAVSSSERNTTRKVLGSLKAGDSPSFKTVPSGHCVRINTGAPLPAGTDAVVQVEDTTVLSRTSDMEENEISMKVIPNKGQDVRPRGSDFKTGELLLPHGTYLDASAIGLLAAAGINSVTVYEKPIVAIISTGDELVDPQEDVPPGKVRDSNRITLLSLLKEENFKGVDIGIVKDEPDAMREALEKAFRIADIVVTTGAMSMGERDLLKSVLIADFNANILFGRVFMKPGKPTCFATLTFEGKMKIAFGLPGNPASAFVTSQLFVLPSLKKISGLEEVFPQRVKAKVEKLVPLEDRPHYVRGVMRYNGEDGSWYAETTGDQRSSRIGSCAGANCLLLFPEGNPSFSRISSHEVEALIIGRI